MKQFIHKGRRYKVRKTNGKLIILFGLVEIHQNKHNRDLFDEARKALKNADTDNNVIDLSDRWNDLKKE